MAFAIYEPSDCGRVDVAASSINEGTSTITFAPRTESCVLTPGGDATTLWWWFHARLTGCAGRQPTLKIPLANKFDEQDYWCFSEDDGATWTRFSSVTADATHFIYSHSAAFTADTVLIATFEPWTVAAMQTWVRSLLDNSIYAHPLSLGTDGVVGFTGGTRVHGQMPTSLAIPQMPVYGLRISNDGVPRKDKYAVVLGTFNHAGEHTGAWTFKGCVDWIVGGSDDANALLQIADFYVFPSLHPEGQLIGQTRAGTSETLNHNRNWILDSDAPIEVRIIGDAIRRAINQQVCALCVDFHANAGTGASVGATGASQIPCTSAGDADRETDFTAALVALRSDLGAQASAGTSTGYFANLLRQQFGAIVATTMESRTTISGTGGILGTAAAEEFGQQIGQAIYDWMSALTADRNAGTLHRNSDLSLGDTTNWVVGGAATSAVIASFVDGPDHALQLTGAGVAVGNGVVGFNVATADFKLGTYCQDVEVSFWFTFAAVTNEGEAALRFVIDNTTITEATGTWFNFKIMKVGTDYVLHTNNGGSWVARITGLAANTTYHAQFLVVGYGTANCNRAVTIRDEDGGVVGSLCGNVDILTGNQNDAIASVQFPTGLSPTNMVFKIADVRIGPPRYGCRLDAGRYRFTAASLGRVGKTGYA
ncbi:MAG: hypothetical protein WC378_00005, partial [Opitutaceae bacterium]